MSKFKNEWDWTNLDDPIPNEIMDKFEIKKSPFQPKVLKDQVVKFYKKPKKMKNGYISYGVIDGPLFTRNKEVK